jgi:hypothetical protein
MTVPPRSAAPNTRRAAWLLGSRLTLAALANDRGLAPNDVPKWFDQARSAARLLRTTVSELPESTASAVYGSASETVINYLDFQYQRIIADLRKQAGPEHAALFEVAMRSNTLLMLYNPGTADANSIAATISRSAPQARLPAELWKPVVDLIGKKGSLADVRAAVREMHNRVDQYLANGVEQSGR